MNAPDVTHSYVYTKNWTHQTWRSLHVQLQSNLRPVVTKKTRPGETQREERRNDAQTGSREHSKLNAPDVAQLPRPVYRAILDPSSKNRPNNYRKLIQNGPRIALGERCKRVVGVLRCWGVSTKINQKSTKERPKIHQKIHQK